MTARMMQPFFVMTSVVKTYFDLLRNHFDLGMDFDVEYEQFAGMNKRTITRKSNKHNETKKVTHLKYLLLKIF